jgi:hypothetical protein
MNDTSTSMGPWFTAMEPHGTLGATVWELGPNGNILVADCTNKKLTIATQRLNARLCAAAPAMADILMDAFGGLSFEEADRARELFQYVFGSDRKV